MGPHPAGFPGTSATDCVQWQPLPHSPAPCPSRAAGELLRHGLCRHGDAHCASSTRSRGNLWTEYRVGNSSPGSGRSQLHRGWTRTPSWHNGALSVAGLCRPMPAACRPARSGIDGHLRDLASCRRHGSDPAPPPAAAEEGSWRISWFVGLRSRWTARHATVRGPQPDDGHPTCTVRCGRHPRPANRRSCPDPASNPGRVHDAPSGTDRRPSNGGPSC